MYSEKNLILLVIGAIEREAEVGYQEGGEVALSSGGETSKGGTHTLRNPRQGADQTSRGGSSPADTSSLAGAKTPSPLQPCWEPPTGKSAQPLNEDEHMANMGDFVLICAH